MRVITHFVALEPLTLNFSTGYIHFNLFKKQCSGVKTDNKHVILFNLGQTQAESNVEFEQREPIFDRKVESIRNFYVKSISRTIKNEDFSDFLDYENCLAFDFGQGGLVLVGN